MSMNNKGLGRGLDALFGGSYQHPANSPESSTPLINISVNALEPNPWQPRSSFSDESLKELANSIRSQGILQPLLVRNSTREGFYQIIAGERRWRAAQLAGLAQVPAVIRPLADREVMIAALIENIQRDNLNPIEEARGLRSLKETLDLGIEALAGKVGKSRGSVSNSLRLLKLDPETQEKIADGSLTSAHARALLSLEEPDAVASLRDHILETGMTAKEAGEAADLWRTEHQFPWGDAESGQETGQEAGEKSKKERVERDPEINKLAREIGTTLNCRAKISGNADRGRISLNYDSNEQLFELLEKLGLTLAP